MLNNKMEGKILLSISVREGKSSHVIDRLKRFFKEKGLDDTISVREKDYKDLKLRIISVEQNISNYDLDNKIEISYYNLVKELVISHDSIEGLMVHGTIHRDKIKFFQYWYHIDNDSIYDIHSLRISDYDIFDSLIIREKLFTATIDEIDKINKDSKTIQNKRFKVHFRIKNGKQEHDTIVDVTKYLLTDNTKISNIVSGPRNLSLHSFRVQITSHDNQDIKKIIKKKLDERGFEIISIEEMKDE